MNSWSDVSNVVKGFDELCDDWDGQGAAVPTAKARDTAFWVDTWCSGLEFPVPSSVMVAPNGDIVFAWQQFAAYVELTVNGAGQQEWFFGPMDRVADQEPQPTADEIAAQREEALRRAVERLVAEIPVPPPPAPPRPLRPTRDPATVPEVVGPSHRRFKRQPPAKTFGSTREAGRREVSREELRAFRRKRKENQP